MNNIITVLILTIVAINSNAQAKLDDFGRIVLNTYLSDKIAIPSETKNLLITKLNQITSNNGMGGSQANPRFIITADVNVGTKDIIAGPPQMISQNLEVTLFIGDALSNPIYKALNESVISTYDLEKGKAAYKRNYLDKNPNGVADHVIDDDL